MLITMMMMIIYACSLNEEALPDPSSDSVMLKKALNGPVYVVPHNGVDDTGPLFTAFNQAKEYGPGCTVQLEEGTYYIDFVEVRDFIGAFKGAGKGKSIITSLSGGLDCEELAIDGYNAFLIKFIGGDVRIADMTLKAPSEALCNAGWAWPGLLQIADYSDRYTSDNAYIKASVNNVEFAGQWLESDYSCYSGLLARHDPDGSPSGHIMSQIDITVTNCSFNNFMYGADFSCIKLGKLVLGTKNNGNVFNNCMQPTDFYNDINVEISAVSNVFNIPKGWFFGLDVDNWPWDNYTYESQYKRTIVNIEGNEFNLFGGDCGLWLHEARRFLYPEEANLPMAIMVKNNKVYMTDEAYVGFSMPELAGPVIENNKFSGTGFVGMASGSTTPGNFTENGLYIGNSFSDASFSFTALLLGVWSRDFTVIGGNNKDNVTDLGINNVITGANVNTAENPLGQSIIDNLQAIKAEVRSMKKPN